MKLISMTLFFVIVMCIAIAGYMQLPMFGKIPQGERLLKIKKSINYDNGQFHNVRHTPMLIASKFKAVKILFSRIFLRLDPVDPLPTVKTDIKAMDRNEDALVWFGHSSYFFYLNGKSVLVDPLFSRVSSPLLFWPKAFKGTDIYTAEDMPEIDYLVITHDHWDHLDYETVLKLKPKVKKVVCGLGVGEHFEYWGFNKNQIIEMDWGDSVLLGGDFTIYCFPARHFSGRGILRNKTLWASFLVKTGSFSLYIGGDSGYDAHYADIGRKFGSIDLAILDSGQHNESWKYVHMMTDEVIKASKDLRAKMLIPVHLGKLSLANHVWNEPFAEIFQMAKNEKFLLLTPMIGEKINLRSHSATTKWWDTANYGTKKAQ